MIQFCQREMMALAGQVGHTAAEIRKALGLEFSADESWRELLQGTAYDAFLIGFELRLKGGDRACTAEFDSDEQLQVLLHVLEELEETEHEFCCHQLGTFHSLPTRIKDLMREKDLVQLDPDAPTPITI